MSRTLQSDNNGLYFIINDTPCYRFTEHFSVSEMFATKHSEFAEINYKNVPALHLLNLHRLCCVLEIIRHHFGDTQLLVSSGYRCPGLNSKVGGVYNSYHTTGQAADLLIEPTLEVIKYFRQLQDMRIINEFKIYKNYVHISVPDNHSVNDVNPFKKYKYGKS